MPVAIQSRTRIQIRESIGYNLADMILSTCTSTGDNASLLDTFGLGRGGDDEYNGRYVYITETHGSGKAAAGDQSIVTDFASGTSDATLAPTLSGTGTVSGKGYEMWKVFLVDEINDAINQVIMEATKDVQQFKEIDSIFTESNKYEYDTLSGYTGLFRVEYVSGSVEVVVDRAEVAWTAGSNTTVTADTSFKKEGNASAKIVVAAGAGTDEILAYEDISSIDISKTNRVEFWMYSSIALTAGQLQIHLSETAAIASAEETIDIPAMDAATWYRHSIALENPQSDTAIISVGIYQVSDVGACTLYVDDIVTVAHGSKVWEPLNNEFWWIAKDSTNYLHITQSALSLMGASTQLRLTGFQNPSLLSADSTTSEIDPAYLIAKVTGRLLVSHAKSSRLDIEDRSDKSKYWLEEAARLLPGISTPIMSGTRSL